MKEIKPIIGHVVAAMAVMAAAGCDGGSAVGIADGCGQFRLNAGVDARVTVSASSRAGDDQTVSVNADDLSIRLLSADGRVDRTFASISDFSSDERFRVGAYTISAFYGSIENEGFDAPYYYGETKFTIVHDEVTDVSVTASLANSMVSVVPTEAFLKYFGSEFSSSLHSVGGANISVASGESRPVYLRPGSVTLTTSVTLPAGDKVTLEAGTFQANPRTHYNVTLDVDRNFGEAELIVTFDEMTDVEPFTIVLSPEVINAPAPTVTATASAVTVPMGELPDADLRFDIMAPGTLRSLTLTTSGAPDLFAAGWPAEIDLVGGSAESKAVMQAFGLRTPGAGMSATTFASVVLTDVVPRITDNGATFTLRATDRTGKVSETPATIIVNLTDPLPKLGVAPAKGGVWATHAYLSVANMKPGETPAFYLGQNSRAASFARIDAERQADGTYLITGLQPATIYYIKVSVDGTEQGASSPNVFTTESAAQVPNGDFEQLRQTISANLQQGGQWTISRGGTRYTTTADIAVSEPEGWATTNAKTFYADAANRNTWYMIPSVFNVGLSWVTNQPTAKIMGIGQSAYKETPALYQNLSAHSGSNAMIIRNVAWDAAGPAIDYKNQTGNTSYSNYYCSNVPAVANRSAGKMFLGSYSFDGANETLNQGVSFGSRPVALTGYYKYEADSHSADEAGTVTVEILNGNDVIGRGHMELVAVGDYTLFTLPLVYSANDREATSLRILFSSSNRPDSEIVTTDRCDKLECCSRGSALTVDNLMFNY